MKSCFFSNKPCNGCKYSSQCEQEERNYEKKKYRKYKKRKSYKKPHNIYY